MPLAVPFWDIGTYRAIGRSLLSRSVVHGPDLGRLRSLLIERLGVAEAILCSSGSLALEIALRACEVRPGDEVVIPTFCCTAIVSPILAVGVIPVFADVGAELNITAESLDAVLTKKTKAIIVPHLFGNPADIDAIIDLTRDRKIRIIDDAAQALGATIAGQPVGSLGDAGIISFGSEKVCSGIGGGAVVYRSKEAFKEYSQADLLPPAFSPTLKSFLDTMIWRRWRRWTLPLSKALSNSADVSPDLPPKPYRKEIMANLQAAVAATLMQTLHENLAARRARVQAYRELLGTEQALTLIPHRPGSACLTQVVRVPAQGHRDELSTGVVETLARAGYEIQGSYLPIHLLPYYERWRRQALPYAEKVWSDLIELPCEPDVKLDQVESIAAIIKRAINT